MPNVCFFMIVYQSDYVLAQCLESALPFGRVVAVEGPVAYWRQADRAEHSKDRTRQILADYRIPAISGRWLEKDDMCQAGERLIPSDTDFVWVLDSDEIWRAETISAILDLLEASRLDSMAFSAISFYGGFDRVMTGFEENFEVVRIQRWYPGARWHTHRPPTVLAPDGRPWRQHRHLSAVDTKALGLRFYHYSYVWPTQMKRKAAYYHDRDPGGTIPNYFERIYLPWVNGSDATRAMIEKTYLGVHDWLPDRRGACYTAAFAGEHPEPIAAAMPALKDRFDRELAEVIR